MTPISRTLIAALLLVTPAAVAQEPKAAAKKAARPLIYDVKADADVQIKATTALAARDSRRVLVMFGGDWCGWCHKLHDLFAADPAIRKLLAEEYVVAMVDVMAPNAQALLKRCKGDLKDISFPYLAVLDGRGEVVTRQKTDPLEEGDHHDPAKVKEFLGKWTAPKVSSPQALEEALAKASSEEKLVFLHFGAPWCGWCHKLDAFLAREDMASILGLDFVDVKIDMDRMTGAEEVLRRYNPEKSGGIPWFAFLDAKGKAIVTSDGPKGNIGFPAAPEEIEHFVAMLKMARRRIEPAQVEAIGAALKAAAEKPQKLQAKAAG